MLPAVERLVHWSQTSIGRQDEQPVLRADHHITSAMVHAGHIEERASVDVRDRVLKPAHDVFTAIVDPAKLSRFFISSASGPLKARTTVEWAFADVGAKLSVDVKDIEPDRKIVFEWTASGTKALVTITLEARGPNATLVRITEDGWPLDRDGVTRALGQTAGWTDFICCMKADLQHAINLRAGRTKEDH